MKERFIGIGIEDKSSKASWASGVITILACLVTVGSSFLTGVLFLAAGILLLPPVKARILRKNKDMSNLILTGMSISLIITALVVASFSGDKQPKEQLDINKPISNEVLEPVALLSEPVADESGLVENPFNSESAIVAALPVIIPIEPEPIKEPEVEEVVYEPEPEPEPVIAPAPVFDGYDDCSNLPRTCGAMSSCAQAQKALACGNRRLDRDKDGTACDKMCG